MAAKRDRQRRKGEENGFVVNGFVVLTAIFRAKQAIGEELRTARGGGYRRYPDVQEFLCDVISLENQNGALPSSTLKFFNFPGTSIGSALSI
jgi:hypothetical protein